MKIFMKITILVCIYGRYLTSEGSRRDHFRHRSLWTLTNESKTIIPGGILSYNEGQLPAIQKEYKDITRRDYDMPCIRPWTYNHLSQRASCPWKFVENIDENRIPRVIYEAKCSTIICLGGNISGCLEHGCEEVKHFTWVKRKVSRDPEHFQNILEPVSVGCTCACKRFVRSISSSVQRPVMCN